MDQKSLEKTQIIVVDDHESVLGGTISLLKEQYPEAEILTAQTAQSAQEQVELYHPDLAVVDLSIPEKLGEKARSETGIQLLKSLMADYPTLNLTVQSSYVRALVRIKPTIDSHQGGFTIADKGLSSREMLTRINWALQGLTHTKDLTGMQSGLEMKPEWLELLDFAFKEGLQEAVAGTECFASKTFRRLLPFMLESLETITVLRALALTNSISLWLTITYLDLVIALVPNMD